MGPDQLTRGERIRLEAFAQAASVGGIPMDQAEAEVRNQAREQEKVIYITLDDIFARALQIEAFLKRADEDNKGSAN